MPATLNMDADKVHENLRTHNHFIRDYLAPNMIREGYKISTSDQETLHTLFASLMATPITKEALQYSHIHKALMMITSGGAPWPYEYTILAETLLSLWKRNFGPLQAIKPNLLGLGGRLRGLQFARDSGIGLPGEEKGRTHMTVHIFDPERAHKAGHLDFKVGDWWLNTEAACRDGIIDNPHGGVTYDDNLAYAIVLTANDETLADSYIAKVEDDGKRIYRTTRVEKELAALPPAWTEFRISSREAATYKLLKSFLNESSSIRILRSHDLECWMAPRAGVRYDGLYQIRGYSILNRKEDEGCVYFFLVQRMEQDQEPFAEALRHPLSDEMDDWLEYQRLYARMRGQDMMKVLNSGLESGTPSPELYSPRRTPMPKISQGDYFSAMASTSQLSGAARDEEYGTPKATGFALTLDVKRKVAFAERN